MLDISPTRWAGEKFEDYKERMRKAKRSVKSYLRGRFLHVSTRPVWLEPDADATRDGIEKGLIKTTGRRTVNREGKLVELYYTKGETYVKPEQSV